MAILNSNQQPIIGWRTLVVTQVVNAVDADATAFIAAAGITNLTQAAAINTLVNDLKTYGLWTKMKALYPMVGGTATSHKFNLKDPRDLDAAYRLGFGGGWTHSSTGALPNGTNAYANTYLHTKNVLTPNNLSIGLYTNTNRAADTSPSRIAYGNADNNTTYVPLTQFYLRSSSNQLLADLGDYNYGRIIGTNTSTAGFYVNTRTANNSMKVFKNNTLFGSSTTTNPTNTLPNSYLYFAAFNESGSYATSFEIINFQFSYVSDGLSDTEAANFYNSVQKFQTTLGRQIGSPIVSDTDAQAFINAAGLTDLGQANAVNALVVDLKAAGVWTKMKALYPFVGGTATTHKWNLKDPRDLDAAFRLVFNGGWTHTSTGALPNGTTGYADTKMLPASYMTSSTLNHMSYYSRTNTAKLSEYVMGLWTGTKGFSMILRRDNNSQTFISDSLSTSYRAAGNTLSTDSRGFYIGTQQGANIKLFRNDILQASNTVASTNTSIPDVYTIYLGALNYMGTPSDTCTNKETAFASIGDGLTDTEASVFYTAVQKYQTSLGRQIGTPVLAEGQTAGLLETYSGAAAAYSLRKLRNGYYGNAIRVRRSSDNAEQDITFKADGTLDTVSLLAFVGSGNGFVTTWYDQSGNNNHIIQTTAANQPQVVSSGSVILDGTKPSVQFNGTTTTLNATFSGVTISGLNNMAVICACKTTFNNAGISPLGLMYFGPDTGWGQVSLSLQAQNVRYRFGTGQSSNNPSYNYSSFGSLFSKTLLSTYHQGVNEVLRINGSDRLTYNNKLATIANTGNQFGMGGNYTSGSMLYHQGTISEMIIYVNDQMSNRAPIESNINSFYSIY